MVTMALQLSNGGYFWNYQSTFYVGKNAHVKLSTLNNVDMTWNFTSADNGQPGNGSVTLYNIAPQHQQWKMGDPISLWTGPESLFGRLSLGKINKISHGNDDKDVSTTLNWSETAGIENQQNIKLYNGAKTVTENVKKTKNNPSGTKKKVQKAKWAAKTFNRGINAKAIIKWISHHCKIKITRLKLAKNMTYKKGYRLSQQPLRALQNLANDCQSKVYYRNGGIAFDNLHDNNPYKEHIALGLGSGLLQLPTVTQKVTKNKKGKVTSSGMHSFNALEDPRVLAGSSIFFDCKGMSKNLYTVQSVTHQFTGDGYTMSGKIYG